MAGNAFRQVRRDTRAGCAESVHRGQSSDARCSGPLRKISVPTLVVSVHGMYVSLPGAAQVGAFGALEALSVLVIAALAVLFRRRNGS